MIYLNLITVFIGNTLFHVLSTYRYYLLSEVCVFVQSCFEVEHEICERLYSQAQL